MWPDWRLLLRIRKRESANAANAAPERDIEIFPPISCQYRGAGIDLYVLQQLSQLDVGLSMVTVFHLTALAEKGIGFVKQ